MDGSDNMYLIRMMLIWLFGLTCGLSVASWLIASERIGDAIVFVYLTNGAAIAVFVAIIVFLLRYSKKKSRHDKV